MILTGMLSDGAAGLRSAMLGLEVDYCIDLAEIGPSLELLVRRAGP